MKNPIAVRLLLAPLISLVALTAAGRSQTSQPTWPRQPQQVTLQSTILAEERRLIIRLPRHYDLDSTARYPVIYKFDGDNELRRYDESIDILHSMDAIPDVIVVGMSNGRGARNRDLTPASLHQEVTEEGQMGTGEMGRGDRFLDFVEKEVIPYVERNYRTTSERILSGHSRGALLVLQSLFSKTDLFQARFIFSAPLTRDERRMIRDTGKFLREHQKEKSFVYFNWGEFENEGMNNSYLAIRELFAASAPKGMRWTIERARTADHQSTQPLALASALSEYFSVRPAGGTMPKNRTGRVTSAGGSPKRR